MFANSNSYDDDEEMYVGILQKHFGPNALPLNELAKKMFDLVDGDDNGKKQLKDTLLVESTCSDGICREATANLEERWGGAFRIGGLSGFPFGGTSAVKEIANQAPDGGDVFLIYAPHVGFSGSCEIGRLERPGKDTEEPRCCESNLTAVNQVNKELRRNMVKKEQVRWGGGGGGACHTITYHSSIIRPILLPFAALRRTTIPHHRSLEG